MSEQLFLEMRKNADAFDRKPAGRYAQLGDNEVLFLVMPIGTSGENPELEEVDMEFAPAYMTDVIDDIKKAFECEQILDASVIQPDVTEFDFSWVVGDYVLCAIAQNSRRMSKMKLDPFLED